MVGCQTRPRGPDILFVATPEAVGLEMLRLARVTAEDLVYDLGSGDGRLVIDAARVFGARGVGVEIEPQLVQQSRENALKAGVADRARFLWQDLFETDVQAVTVVTLYLRDDVNLKLRPKLLRELRPGARVVSHDFGMAEWEPDRTLRVRGPDREHRVLLWTVPARVEGVWTLQIARPGAAPVRLLARQRFQRFEGTLDTPDGALPVREGRVDGERIEFRAGGNGAPAMLFTGRIAGDRAEGTVDVVSGGGAPRSDRWTAVRTR